MRNVIVAEVQFVVHCSGMGLGVPLAVAVEGIGPEDQSIGWTQAQVLSVWLNAARRRA